VGQGVARGEGRGGAETGPVRGLGCQSLVTQQRRLLGSLESKKGGAPLGFHRRPPSPPPGLARRLLACLPAAPPSRTLSLPQALAQTLDPTLGQNLALAGSRVLLQAHPPSPAQRQSARAQSPAVPARPPARPPAPRPGDAPASPSASISRRTSSGRRLCSCPRVVGTTQ
jgi:hypothetical protein